jgi:hypothetical protein
MAQFRLNRRTVLRGAGTIAIALPWLEAMGTDKLAHAQSGTPAKRFLTVYQPGGNLVIDHTNRPMSDPYRFQRFWPTAANPSSSPVLAPLAPIESEVLVLRGVTMQSAVGEQHQAGIVGWLTGARQIDPGTYVSYPSIDQVLEKRMAQEATRKISGGLQVAVRWATGKSKGRLHPINAANFADDGNATPIPPAVDPVAIYNDLFGDLNPGSQVDARIARKKSILDFVDRKYETLAARLGASDRAKLLEHLEKIRELEKSLDVIVETNDRCRVIERQDTTGYRWDAGLFATDTGSETGAEITSTDEMIPKVGKYMMDMMVMAMACDMTAVGSFQWSDTEAKHRFPWLGLNQHHHYYQHDGGFNPEGCEKIAIWYSEQHAYLLQEMKKVDMGGHSLLDESVVFFGSEISDPETHRKDQMPFILAGRGGGLRPGRVVTYNGVSHNNLLVAILNLFGDERTTFGEAQFNSGALSGLT